MSDADTSPSLTARSRLLTTAVWVAVLTALNMLLAVLLVGIAPASKKTFDEYNLQLSSATKLALQIGDWYSKLWYVLVPLTLLLVVGGVPAARHLFRRTWPGNVFAAACLFLTVLVLTVTAAGLWMGQVQLQEGLMK